MRHLLLIMGIMFTFAAFNEVTANGFSNPLAEMTVSWAFGATGGTHIGTDLDGNAGDAIYAIADGQVCFYKGDADAYGGGSGDCAEPGAVLFVRHRKSNGDYFIAQYGHIQNVPSEFQQITTFTFNGPSVSQGHKIAEIGVYSPKRDCSLGRDDHLHFGIWDSNNQIPMNSWGYHSDPCWTTPAGCWVNPTTFLTNESPYSNSFSSLFTAAYTRNGESSTVGTATTGFYSYGPYIRKDYSGGSYGSCCIMYDPNNGTGNPAATNEAYLLRTGFYEYYFANGGWQAFGCPSLDEYHPETGASGDAIQFFVRRVGNETQFHYMYFEANLPTNQPPAEVLSWHSSYTTEWVTQDPNVQFNMAQGTTRTFTVKFRNTGQTTWRSNSSSYPYDYVELKSCNSNGVVTESFFNYPYDGSLGWFSTYAPCTMVESSVAPGNDATFTFTGKVVSNASLGLKNIYFRPYHSTGGLLSDWGGMHYVVNVVEPVPEADYTALVGHFNTDGAEDIGLYEASTGRWFVASNSGSSFNQINGPYTYNCWLDDWGTGSGFTPLVGDFTGDGKADICVYRPQYGRWYVARNDGDRFTQVNGPYTENSWFTDWGTGSGLTPLVGYFNSDNLADIALYEHSTGRWFVAFNNYGSSNTFSQANGPYIYSSWFTDWGAGSGLTALTGDFNGDSKTDIGLYEASTGRWFVAFNNYGTQNSFSQANGTYIYSSWYTGWGAGSGIVPLVGDFNNDGKSDIAYYQSQYGRWYVAYNDYGTYNRFDVASGTATNGSWLTDWGTGSGYAPLVGNFSSGPHDIGLYDPANGRWFVAFNNYGTAQSFTQYNGPYPYNAWYDDWGKESGGQGKIVSPQNGETSNLPITFSLSQNYPNPFNPATTVSYTLPASSPVTLEVYNTLGQKVATLVDEFQQAGEHTAQWDCSTCASGVYFYRLRSGESSQVRKMILLK